MTGKNVSARIVKLEGRRRRNDGLLLVWRKPGTDVRQALSTADYSPGDKVICVEWHSDGPKPEPAWHTNRLRFDVETEKHLQRSLDTKKERLLRDVRDPAFLTFPLVPSHKLSQMTDHELWHSIYGVVT